MISVTKKHGLLWTIHPAAATIILPITDGEVYDQQERAKLPAFEKRNEHLDAMANENTYHFVFSSSVSAKKRISWSAGNIKRKDRSTPYNPSYSSAHLLPLRPDILDAGLIALFRTSWSSSTAMAFLRSIVAVALFVTSLKATRLAPMTRNCRRRHV